MYALRILTLQYRLRNHPLLLDNSLEVKEFVRGINNPTDLAFLGPNDLLILEQYNGTVRRVKDGKIMSKPMMDVNVGNFTETGLLGIEIMQQESGRLLFFYIIQNHKQETEGVY